MNNKIFHTICFTALFNLSASFAGETQLELNQESHQKRLMVETKLNQTIQQYKKLIDPEYINLFNQSEANWKKYIHSYCKFISQKNIDGSIYPLVLNNCLANKITQHTKAINQLLKCAEGDLQCLPIN
ncbi:DUF1311 domain-containing protein [Francisellaceae bacterium]|nr:DUF1311 domain-containing protein [Francisellaceae bacterium]